MEVKNEYLVPGQPLFLVTPVGKDLMKFIVERWRFDSFEVQQSPWNLRCVIKCTLWGGTKQAHFNIEAFGWRLQISERHAKTFASICNQYPLETEDEHKMRWIRYVYDNSDKEGNLA